MINTTLCYIEHNNQYLMLHRDKKEKDLNAQKWIGVGGKFEPGETVEECLIREVYEETGLTLTAFQYVGMIKFESDIYEAEDMYLFKGTEFSGELSRDCTEGTLKWVDKDKVLSLPTWEGDRYFLAPLLQGKTNLNMTVRYEGDKLVSVSDDSKPVEIEKSKLIQAPHGFSTKIGGISDGIFSTLNLGMSRGDIPERVTENWRRFLDAAGISNHSFVCGKQVHGNTVHIATAGDERPAYGKYPCSASKSNSFGSHNSAQTVSSQIVDADARPVTGETELIEADGYVTKEKNLPIAIFTADCVPVLLEDAQAGVVGAVHCGWRSTVADIESETIRQMQSLGSNVSDIKIAIGAAIDKCCFEVGNEVIEAVEKLIGLDEANLLYSPGARESKYMLNLRGVVACRFRQLGIPDENIEIIGGCTMCHPDRYYSHRFTNGQRGSMASVIMLR